MTTGNDLRRLPSMPQQFYSDTLRQLSSYQLTLACLELDPSIVAVRGCMAIYDTTGLVHRRLKDVDLIATSAIERRLEEACDARLFPNRRLSLDVRRVSRRS